MEKVLMLTKDDCPKCEALKKFLELALRNKYQDDIKIIKKEVDEDYFQTLVTKHEVKATPVLIYEDQVLSDTSPGKVIDFLESNLEK